MSDLLVPPADAAPRSDRLIYAICVAFSAFQLWTAAWSPLPSQVVRSLHVGFLLLLVYALCARRAHASPRRAALPWGLGALAFALAFYHWIFLAELIQRAGDPSLTDLIVGCAVTLLVFDAARRLMGWALPLICAVFLAYALFGQYLPEPLAHRGYAFEQVVEQLYLGTEGLYGIPTYVSSSYIFLFIVFGAFLERAGMVQLFTDVAMGSVGHLRGGPAKVSVVSSGLMGTINGSGVANVVTTGQFTIPLMKRFGYRAEFAGAVEATASMGGQIMPPVMGAVAFIMAETLGVPYVDICTAAVIPALLYFFTTFWMVHLEAGRAGLHGLPKAQCPDALAALRARWYLILPLAVLVWLLFAGYTPLFAGSVGLALTALLILGSPLATRLGMLPRVLFWIALGLAASAFLRFGINVLLGLIALLVAILCCLRGGRATLCLARDSLADGARHAVPVGVACALVGTIMAVTTLTGVASQFASLVIDLGANSLLLSLMLTMLACLLLGMGIPTIPNYIITSALAAPALLHLGVPLIVSHMFVFYFGIMADLTPPVALAAFAAAPIAHASGLKIGMNCLRIAIAGFVVPYMAVYEPALMLQGDPGPLVVIYAVGKALLAILLWGAASIGYCLAPLNWAQRLLAASAAGTLVAALPLTDELGFALAAAFFAWHLGRRRLHPAH